ncbi:phenylalanine--tRNA ligase alpha subunit [Alphaproteobacteria bacterium]|nr:phenylalanine--tRNA ligase alpha subunit [Alphaproteobacteria bacterium]
MINLENILTNFNSQFAQIQNPQQLEELRINFLGKKGIITELFANLKSLNNEEKKSFGNEVNKIRDIVSTSIENKKNLFINLELNAKLAEEKIDLSAPIRPENKGSLHPITRVMSNIEKIFSELNFEFAYGPEIEDDFHNFSALNIPEDHPARQMQDTFYLKDSDLVLRTHTSNTQIRKMLSSQVPLRVCSLGKVFRKEFDQTHSPMFHQFEGFVVDKNVTMENLKWTLEYFLQKFFEVDNIQLRFRASFFPFTEPSAEVDINYGVNNGKIEIGKGDKFMEILGCGMIHPNVLKNCQIDHQQFQGFAFGVGIERLAMLKYGITDLRLLYENDIRFLKNFA